MINLEYEEELKFLEKYDVSDEEKIKLIENLYRLSNICFNEFVKNDGKKIF